MGWFGPNGVQVVPIGVSSWGSDFDRLTSDLRLMMDEMEGKHYFRSHAPDHWCPRLNVYETSEAYLVCVELAGMPREKIDVRADCGVLTIKGNRPRPPIPSDSDDVSVQLMEIDSGRFHRQISVPSDVDVDGIKATYRSGYLWIMMPRVRGATGSNNA